MSWEEINGKYAWDETYTYKSRRKWITWEDYDYNLAKIKNRIEWDRFEEFKDKWVLYDSIDKPLRTVGARTKYTLKSGSYYKNKFGKR